MTTVNQPLEGRPAPAVPVPSAETKEERVRRRNRPEHRSLPVEAPTRQFAMLVLTDVVPAKLERLRALLGEIGEQTIQVMQGREPADVIFPFLRVKTLHYARFVLVERPGEGQPPQLAFSTNYDGPLGHEGARERVARRLHLDELCREAGPALERIYAHCTGLGEQPLARYLARHHVPAATFYVGSQGRSCHQIVWESDLRRDVDQIIDRGDLRDRSPTEIRDAVLADLKKRPAYARGIPRFPPQPDHRWKVALVAAALVFALLVAPPLLGGLAAEPHLRLALRATPLFFAALGALGAWRLRSLEDTDPQFQIDVSDKTHRAFETASAEENWFLQNQLSHLVNIKPGPLRWALIRIVFFGLKLLATHVFNKGMLGEIPSIHFARWVLIPGRGVLFFSNFDSSWQSYLGDFIDKASIGLTGVWSNTVSYPRTKWLLQAGSQDAARFLAWTRAHQIPTQVWYCAYPGLSIVNVNDNTEIRRGLADPSSMDAAAWLLRLRSVDSKPPPVDADDTGDTGAAPADQGPPEALPLHQIQGLILKGYGHKPEARYLMLRLHAPGDAARASAWLSKLPLTSAAEAPRAKRPAGGPHRRFVNVAFTHAGLRALGVDPALCDRFSTPFVQNSDHPYRARLVGDVGDENKPSTWAWGSGDHAVHVALLVFSDHRDAADEACRDLGQQAADAGLDLVVELSGHTLPGRKEHFGFRDGIAQPVVAGSGRDGTPGNTLPAGEFLLGHRDAYGNVSSSPLTASGFNFGLNGSYLVFRQLEQRVEAFWAYCEAQSRQKKLDAVTVASKMVGRWPSGATLVRHPEKDPNHPDHADHDAFSYLEKGADNDREGARCPFAAHVRRSNPRDWALAPTPGESLKLSRRHRLMRRGRPYGPPLDPQMRADEMVRLASTPAGGAEAARGLNFLCFNANLDRQFEFVQQVWCNNPNFAGLNSDSDPLLGAQVLDQLELDPASFTMQHRAPGTIEPRCTGLPSFVRVRGSSYFFMPSIPAVRLLGTSALRATEAPALETPAPDEQLHIDSLIDTLRAKMKRDYVNRRTRRDAHPKMHGCVRARFIVEGDLDASLRVGLFARPGTYEAWVRFSNQDGTVSPDSKKDIRGAAIKLLDVRGPKLLDGEEDATTHDFLLISHDVFVTRDVAEFDGLIQAVVGGPLAMPWFLARHPRVALNLLASLKHHASPLEIRYHSVAPYLFGRRAVKYSLRPQGEAKTPIPTDPGPDYLREALATHLGKAPAYFDFMVQIQGDAETMPIEDPGVRWSEAAAPFRKVATLAIMPQTFDTPEQDEFGDNLSFNPWRAPAEHRPLGGISRARRQVYLALSTFRHDQNLAPRQEPTREDWDAQAAVTDRALRLTRTQDGT